MQTRALSKNTDIEQTVKRILETVKERGFAAVEEYSCALTMLLPMKLRPERLDERRMLPYFQRS